MSKHDVAIIGTGPAGMIAAIQASERGKRVMLIDRNHQLGRKLLSTGNGRCNLTNTHISVDRYHGATPDFIRTIIDQFDQLATMEFFRRLGLVLKEEDEGRVFPRTNQASSVVEVLRRKLAANGVDVALGSQIAAIERPAAWKISTIDGAVFEADKLLIATGGRAAHQLGSTGDGLSWAKRLGHKLVPTHAALVPLETEETWPAEIQGTRVEARSWATAGGETISEATGDLLFTSYGVSGTSILAQAGRVASALYDGQVMLHIDLFADMSDQQLAETISGFLSAVPDMTPADALVGVVPANMIPVVLRLAGDGVSSIARTLKDLTLNVSKLRPLKEAQVTAGGVSADEIDPLTMQSKLVPGLFFAGEVIDVDGDSGGFNLQWAWSSGYVAGKSI